MKKRAVPDFRAEPIAALLDLQAETRLEGFRFEKQTCSTSLYGRRIFECEFRNVEFREGMPGTEFVDVIFDHCDFSNLHMEESSFRRCEFRSCRMVGAKLVQCSLRDVLLDHCLASYINLSASSWQTGEWRQCVMKEGYFTEMVQKNLSVHDCDFTGAEWHHTALTGMDFSDSVLNDCAFTAEDLRGLTVNSQQAARLAALLGLRIKD